MDRVHFRITGATTRLRFASNYLPVLIGSFSLIAFVMTAIGVTNAWITVGVAIAAGISAGLAMSSRPYVEVSDRSISGRNLVRTFSVDRTELVAVHLHSLRLGRGDHCPAIEIAGRRHRLPVLALFQRAPEEVASLLGSRRS